MGGVPLEIPALGGFAAGQTQKREPFQTMFEFFGVVGLTQRSAAQRSTAQLHSPSTVPYGRQTP